jgi:ribose transport system substrate-binding protein
VVNLQGLRGTTAAESRAKRFTEQLKKYPDIKLVAIQAANFDQEKALNLMTDILQANAKIDGVFCANDDNAVGAIKAIDGMHRFKPIGDAGHIVIIGIDGTAQALQAIRDGKLDATISQNPVKMAATAVDFAKAISEGKTVDAHVNYPNMLLDKTTIDSEEANRGKKRASSVACGKHCRRRGSHLSGIDHRSGDDDCRERIPRQCAAKRAND